MWDSIAFVKMAEKVVVDVTCAPSIVIKKKIYIIKKGVLGDSTFKNFLSNCLAQKCLFKKI